MDELAKKIEAVLFIHGEPMDLEKLAKMLGVTKTEIRQAAENLDQDLAPRALTLVWHADTLQLATKPKFAGHVQNLVKEEISRDLSRACAETLAAVAYRGPLPKSEIDFIRGVNSSYVLRNLMVRGLVLRSSDEAGRGYIYQISSDFLKFLGLSRQDQLPEYADFKMRLQDALSKNVNPEDKKV